MLGIVFHFTWIADYTAMLSPVYYPYGMNPINPIKTVVYALIGTSITLVGGTFYHYRGSYGSRMSLAAGICSYIFAWWLLIADLLQYTGLVWVQQTDPYIFYSYWVPGPLGIHYTVLQLIANALLAVTFVLWASAMVVTRHYTRQSSVAIAAAVLFLIPAHIILLTLPYSIVALITSFGYSYGYIYIYSFMSIFSPFLSALIEPACILGAILFYRSRNIWKHH